MGATPQRRFSTDLASAKPGGEAWRGTPPNNTKHLAGSLLIEPVETVGWNFTTAEEEEEAEAS